MNWRTIRKWPIQPHNIVAMAQPYEPVCGVYFLILGNDVVYIGQSINVHCRVAEHKKNGVAFDKWHFIECEKEWLSDLESAFIWQFSPSLNKANNTGTAGAKRSNLKVQVECDRWWTAAAFLDRAISNQ